MDTRLLSLLPTEQARCREIVRQYTSIGGIGCFAAALIEQALRRADRAIIEGGEEDIRAALAELQGYHLMPCLTTSPPPARRPVPTTDAQFATYIPPVGRRPARVALAA